MMDGLAAVGRQNLWNQPVYARFLEEVDPFRDTDRFRPRNRIYAGQQAFWAIPSPEPLLSERFWDMVAHALPDPRLTQAAASLAAGIAAWEADYRRLLLVAILRAGVPIADWLTRLLPGSVAVATSLFCGLGVDQVAIARLQQTYPDRRLLFVDGWTGQGGVARELSRLALAPLAVLIDPWGWADFAGCRDDIFCPTACFTGPTTLGFSRTFYRNDDDLFNAYLFPERYTRPALVQQWQASCRNTHAQPLESTQRFFTTTHLRVHSNEVCRALINADPEVVYFAVSQAEANSAYGLMLELTEERKVKTQFDVGWLREYKTHVACALNKSQG